MQDCYVTNGKRFLAILIDILIVSIIVNYISIFIYFIFGIDSSVYSVAQNTLAADIRAYMSSQSASALEALKDSFNEFFGYFLINESINLLSFYCFKN